jgi:hypothetical protein
MSIFNTTEIPCPTCGTKVSFELVHSVNADRRPDLRQAILDRSFQREACPACKYNFRVDPEFTYLNIQRGQYLAVWPLARLPQWKEIEARSQAAFDKSFGTGAPPEAKALGKKLTARVVFGWAALNEKLIAAEAGIDDRTLELAKGGVMGNLDTVPVGRGSELRLIAVQGDDLKLGWISTAGDELTDQVSVPRSVLAEIEAEPAEWQELRDEIANGMFVDLERSLVVV